MPHGNFPTTQMASTTVDLHRNCRRKIVASCRIAKIGCTCSPKQANAEKTPTVDGTFLLELSVLPLFLDMFFGKPFLENCFWKIVSGN